MKKYRLLCRTALPLLLCTPMAALAQAPQPAPATPAQPAPPAAAAAGAEEPQVAFSADQLTYDNTTDVVTANGAVHMTREGNDLHADRVIWTRATGEVRAEGNVKVTNPQGDVAYGDNVQLTDTLKDGVVENMLLVLHNGGRLAAQRGTRVNGVTTLYHAAYSPCAVTDSDGCPKNPTWEITAVKVVHDPVKHRISYSGASLRLFGAPIIGLPGLSHPDGSQDGGSSGLLVPDVRVSRNNGFEFAVPYYWRIAPNRDLTVTPHVYTAVLPALEAKYRQITDIGAFQLSGIVTYGSRTDITQTTGTPGNTNKGIRAYLDGNGKFQLDPFWSITASGRYVTDRTFLRRYDISTEDRLRSVAEAERISDDSYISIAGWAFQGLRVTDVGQPQPFALPAVDARFRFQQLLGGTLQIQANSLAIFQNEGQDSQRAFASAEWNHRSITPLGQELVLTAFARGDVYHVAQPGSNTIDLYRGDPGWQGRFIGAVAAEVRWPFIGQFLSGTQMITPRLQVVASPPTRNLAIPNQDARSVDLEDSNLFALNRFPGYDRWEDGARVTYGFDWDVNLPSVAIATTVGQSYRLNNKPSILPPGTGLSDRFSDIVGRATVKFGSFVSLVDRFRLDKDSLAVRRNEVDAVIGSSKTYAEIGYLRLNRNIPLSVEDLSDHEEIRLGGRVQIARFWSVFGSTVIDLTDEKEDPTSSADGYQPIRHRLGISYEDDCLEVGITWRRDYDRVGDFHGGNTFLLRVALKNLGR